MSEGITISCYSEQANYNLWMSSVEYVHVLSMETIQFYLLIVCDVHS